MSFKKLSKEIGVPESDLDNLFEGLQKMKDDGVFDTPEMKEFEVGQKRLRESPYKDTFNQGPIPLTDWETESGFIAFTDQMPEKNRKVVLRAHPNAAYNSMIFHYIGILTDGNMISGLNESDEDYKRHYTHYTHWQYEELIKKQD
jgi:hypothetical protein